MVLLYVLSDWIEVKEDRGGKLKIHFCLQEKRGALRGPARGAFWFPQFPAHTAIPCKAGFLHGSPKQSSAGPDVSTRKKQDGSPWPRGTGGDFTGCFQNES